MLTRIFVLFLLASCPVQASADFGQPGCAYTYEVARVNAAGLASHGLYEVTSGSHSWSFSVGYDSVGRDGWVTLEQNPQGRLERVSSRDDIYVFVHDRGFRRNPGEAILRRVLIVPLMAGEERFKVTDLVALSPFRVVEPGPWQQKPGKPDVAILRADSVELNVYRSCR